MDQVQQIQCTVCQSRSLLSRLSLGKHPPSNRFLVSGGKNIPLEDSYSMSVGYCQQCGTIQLVDRMPLEIVRPRYDWLVYNEPEGHLDEVANKISGLKNIKASSRFLGVTYKDQSTLDRMKVLGFSNTECIRIDDLKCSEQPFGLETIQDSLCNETTISRLREKYGRADVLFVRHILEHAPNANCFIRSLRGLLAPNGYMMFELPDSDKIFLSNNHAFIWEEHISYFTVASVNQLVKAVGAELSWLGQYPYPYENSLIVVIRFNETTDDHVEPTSANPEVSNSTLDRFARAFSASREKWHKELATYRDKGQKVALFGAGHLSAKFINFYDLANLIDCVIDDHPKKVGMLMPGSELEIVPSSELLLRGISVCISTLNPESEVKVREKLVSFFDAGGRFIPAFSKV